MRPARVPRKLRKRHALGELRAVVDETIAFFHRLRWVVEQIYGPAGRSTARRGILRGLVRYGAQTVPALARARSVTRQHVQEVVDALVDDGLAAFEKNPAHARSRLVRATARGEEAVRRMDQVDERVLAAVGRGVAHRDLETTARTLGLLRGRFEVGARWRHVAAGE